MTGSLRTPFTAVVPGIGPAGMAPYLPLVLSNAGKSLPVDGVVDSGAAPVEGVSEAVGAAVAAGAAVVVAAAVAVAAAAVAVPRCSNRASSA